VKAFLLQWTIRSTDPYFIFQQPGILPRPYLLSSPFRS
jgi:hypothetical protein